MMYKSPLRFCEIMKSIETEFYHHSSFQSLSELKSLLSCRCKPSMNIALFKAKFKVWSLSVKIMGSSCCLWINAFLFRLRVQCVAAKVKRHIMIFNGIKLLDYMQRLSVEIDTDNLIRQTTCPESIILRSQQYIMFSLNYYNVLTKASKLACLVDLLTLLLCR